MKLKHTLASKFHVIQTQQTITES